MKTIQQDVMCVLLQTLLDKKLITQDIHDKSREKIFRTTDWPELFWDSEDSGKETLHGSA